MDTFSLGSEVVVSRTSPNFYVDVYVDGAYIMVFPNGIIKKIELLHYTLETGSVSFDVAPRPKNLHATKAVFSVVNVIKKSAPHRVGSSFISLVSVLTTSDGTRSESERLKVFVCQS